MVLKRWGRHVAISVDGRPLMSSHEHASEDELGRMLGEHLAGIKKPKVLIGGLGMGFTLRGALDVLPASSKIVVAELLEPVVRWNRGVLGRFAKRPLEDKRVKVIVGDVTEVINKGRGYDAIVLDVDNGPDAITRASNANLYKRAGLARARRALKPGGFLAVWSAFGSKTFTLWLKTSGFEVKLLRPPPKTTGGPRYYIWLARRV